MTHYGVSQMLHFSEMFFFVVFGDKKVSWIPECHIRIRGSWLVQASKILVTTHVFSMTEYKKCTQTLKIILYHISICVGVLFFCPGADHLCHGYILYILFLETCGFGMTFVVSEPHGM